MSITVNALARIKRMQSDQNARCSRTFSITDTGKRLVSFVLRPGRDAQVLCTLVSDSVSR